MTVVSRGGLSIVFKVLRNEDLIIRSSRNTFWIKREGEGDREREGEKEKPLASQVGYVINVPGERFLKYFETFPEIIEFSQIQVVLTRSRAVINAR